MRPAWPGADPGEADPVQEAQHQRNLDRTLASEVAGEIVFAAAARWTRAAERREKWLRLRKLETQTKHRLVDFLEAQGERLLEQGVRFTMTPERQPWGGVMALFQDPAGNVFYLDQLRAE